LSPLILGFSNLILLAQADAGGGADFFSSMAIPIAGMLLLFYFILMRPEQKKRKEMEKALAGIKKNDHVVTVGGIFGTVVAAEAGSEHVTIRVDDTTGTKVKVLRSAISRIGAADEGTGTGGGG
jgi:preprotein translocase subunit YajC